MTINAGLCVIIIEAFGVNEARDGRVPVIDGGEILLCMSRNTRLSKYINDSDIRSATPRLHTVIRPIYSVHTAFFFLQTPSSSISYSAILTATILSHMLLAKASLRQCQVPLHAW
jgi:hypothetical protein